MNVQINKMSFIYFLLQNFHFFFFNTGLDLGVGLALEDTK